MCCLERDAKTYAFIEYFVPSSLFLNPSRYYLLLLVSCLKSRVVVTNLETNARRYLFFFHANNTRPFMLRSQTAPLLK